MLPHMIMQGIPIAIIDMIAFMRSRVASMLVASIGTNLQLMPSLLISQVTLHMIGGRLHMPFIIMGFMPGIGDGIMPIIGIIIGMGIGIIVGIGVRSGICMGTPICVGTCDNGIAAIMFFLLGSWRLEPTPRSSIPTTACDTSSGAGPARNSFPDVSGSPVLRHWSAVRHDRCSRRTT
jgi:hypothetical protein